MVELPSRISLTSWRNAPRTSWNSVKAETRALHLTQRNSRHYLCRNRWRGPDGPQVGQEWATGSWQRTLTTYWAALARLEAVAWEKRLFPMLSTQAHSLGILCLVFRPFTQRRRAWKKATKMVDTTSKEAERGSRVSPAEEKATGS